MLEAERASRRSKPFDFSEWQLQFARKQGPTIMPQDTVNCVNFSHVWAR